MPRRRQVQGLERVLGAPALFSTAYGDVGSSIVIGSSRITYAMSSYPQLPDRLRRLHPRFKTPWLSLILFSGLLSILTLLPGRIDFLGTMYSFGAMLSFAVANASLIGLRWRFPDAELLVRGRPNLRFRGVDWPLFSILGLLGPDDESRRAIDLACLLAAERGARIVALAAVEVPLELPLEAPLPDEEAQANAVLDEARAVGGATGSA